MHRLTLRERDRSLALSIVVFYPERHRLRVIDNATPEGRPIHDNLRQAMKTGGRFLAGCNGGFFRRDPFAPVGFMIGDGRATGEFDPTLWMKGLLVVRGGRPALEPTQGFDATDPTITDLLQTGPWLVRDGRSEPDNNPRRHAARTFIGQGARGDWFIGVSEACSLDELARFLRLPALVSLVDVQRALALDGGPSTGLWARADGFDFYRAEAWTVRNFIGIEPRGEDAAAPAATR